MLVSDQKMKPTLDFYGAPVAIGALLLLLGKATSWCCGRMIYGGIGECQTPWYTSLILAPSIIFVVCGFAPKPMAVQLSAFMHVLKRTHSQPKSKRPFNYHKIRDGLVLGRQFRDLDDLKRLQKEFGVTAVVTLNEEWELFLPSEAVVKQLGGEKYRIRFTVPDYQAPTMSELDKTTDFIRRHIEDGGTVYVHCNAGRGRSSVVVAAYLAATESKWKSAADIVRDMQRIRPTVSFALLDWPFRGQARAVAAYFSKCRKSS